ncbi:hybrid sensor histidine kinase/response regulator [Azospirillum formosense]|uniref:sensor histidine kinase n=1 Tax=Azospirillum formosense TaxID=861533 RepID=UPI00338ED25F
MGAPTKATILIVDDTADNLSLLSSHLKSIYAVKTVNNGDAALRIAFSDQPPDLILLDVMMPSMDGYEVCRRLKADPRTRDVPVIFLTARTSVEDEKFGLDLGAVDYISKPISPPIVLARVKNHLSLKATADSLRATVEEVRAAHSRLEETQQHLIQTEKMAALGLLVSGVAHEINTPIGVALTAVSHLSALVESLASQFQSGAIRKSDLARFLENAREGALLVTTNIVRTANLIQSFKQVVVDRAGSERRVFDLKDYLSDALFGLDPHLREAGHSLTVTCPAGLTIDSHPGPLSEVLSILIRNAVAHAFRPGQCGRVALSVTPRDGDWVELRLSDDGKGIDPEHLPKLFDPFFTTRRGIEFPGLGLYVAFNLVHQVLQGTIDVESLPGGGATFVVRMPRRVSTPAEAPA